MKKIITSFVAGLLVATTYIGVLATTETFTLTKSETPIYVNGVKYPTDTLPILNLDMNGKGNTYVPLRNLSEMLGADVNWNNETKAIDITTDDNVEFATKPMPKPSNAEDLEVYTFNGVEYYNLHDAIRPFNFYTQISATSREHLDILDKSTFELVYENVPIYRDPTTRKPFISVYNYNNIFK